PFAKATPQNDRAFAPPRIVAQRDERSLGRSRIMFGQRIKEPVIRGVGNGARSLRQYPINRLVERSSVPFPKEFICCPCGARFHVIGPEAGGTIQRGDRVGITPKGLVTERDLLQSKKVARV